MTYLTKNTMYLTNHGLKTIDEININEDNIIYLTSSGELLETKDYSIDTQYFEEVYDNYDSSYCRLISNCIEVPQTMSNFIEDDIELKISKFYIKSKDKDEIWYNDFNYDKTLSLSLVVSNYFDLDSDNYISRCDFVSNGIATSTFVDFNKSLGIYFPYNRDLKSYLFKTNLHNNFTNLETKLLDSLKYSKTISKTIYNLVLRGANYKSIVLRNYSIGCLLQIYFNLNNYDTKLVQDGDLFRLTIVKSIENNCAHREVSTKIKGQELGNIHLNSNDGYIIVSQQNDGITNVSFIDNENI